MLNIIKEIGLKYPYINHINTIIGSVLAALTIYKTIYILIGLIFTRKFKKAKKNHKYAILISARNEKNVIGNLLDSINKQTYPKELITTFVVADNCTDNTAEIARNKGAIVYERFDNEHKTKGYALQYLCNKIEEDYKRDSFEGYFIFDADNLLKNDYIERMNESFDAGSKITCSYRNTKNFNENWIAASYGLHWLRTVRYYHRPRSILRLATNIQGTGFLFTNEIIKNGWNYTSLTEDRALTVDAVAQGYEISYNNDAIFYDEQPTSLKIALRQRLRWSRGHLEAFVETGPYLFLNVFLGKYFIKTKWNTQKDNKKGIKKVIEEIRHRFASYDTLMQLTPFSILNIFRWLLISVIIYSLYCYSNGINNLELLGTKTIEGIGILKLFGLAIKVNFSSYKITMYPGIKALILGFICSLWLRLFYRIRKYFENMLIAIYVFIIERKRIVSIPLYKKIFYIFMWPTFDIIGRYTTYIALFKKIEWKPIPHDSKVTIEDINK